MSYPFLLLAALPNVVMPSASFGSFMPFGRVMCRICTVSYWAAVKCMPSQVYVRAAGLVVVVAPAGPAGHKLQEVATATAVTSGTILRRAKLFDVLTFGSFRMGE